MNLKAIEKLEFNKVKSILSDYAVTFLGKKYASDLMPLNNKKEILKAQKQTSEALLLLYKISNPPISEIPDVKVHLKRLENSDSLNLKQLLELCKILKISQNLKEYFKEDGINQDDFSNLKNLFENLYSNPGIIKSIETAIIDENTIDDSASLELKNIRNNIRKKESEIHARLQSILHSKYIQEPIVTIRNNRFVVPVKIEYKQEIKGFVHDTSTSGLTLFIEPISIFEINNEINNLKNQENIEIEKILMKLSALFFDIIDNLQNTVNLIGLLDFIFAKAKFSIEFECAEPIINEEKYINLIDCYHPLIAKDIAVKNTISLGKDFTSLIITGPNTGGKTVVLKTVGLLTMMAMSGLHIPAKEGSSIYIFDEIFADIGDEQSISDSLSTFSSHIINISNILKNVTENSLVLVDELGSGTDPIEGANLAISILEYLENSKTLTIATTHYHEIKNYALVTDGFENASVEFDFDTMSPTYKLLVGVPGRSNAFIISKKLGISEEIINRAKEMINTDTVNIEELLNNIYEDKRIIEEEKKKILENSEETEKLKKKLEIDSDNLKNKEAEIIENAKIKARDILLNAKEDASDIIKELESMPSAKKANSIRNDLNKKISDLSNTEKKQNNIKSLEKSDIKQGIEVYISSLNQNGIIISNVTKSDTVQVQIGSIKTYFNINDISKAVDKPKQEIIKINKKTRELKVDSISPEINVIGQNIEEANFVIDKYLDNCVLNGLNQVRIVHGKGTGILRKGIHNFLNNHPHVKSYRLGTFGEGEDGVTVVKLK